MLKKIRAVASGKVQGVGFRFYTQAQAQKLGICGYVRNLSNGDVEIVAEGEAEKLDALIDWAKSGSPSAVVNNLETEILNNHEPKFSTFEIRR
ncbi:MAG: acylphosphatase [Waterburya sp.]